MARYKKKKFYARKNYSIWGKPEFVNGKWQIRRTYRRAGNYKNFGFTVYLLKKK